MIQPLVDTLVIHLVTLLGQACEIRLCPDLLYDSLAHVT